MPASAAEIRAIAATVHDQDSHSEADLAFLDALWKADSEWHEALHQANVAWGGGSEAWQCVKRMATNRQLDAYRAALAALEAADFEDDDLLTAAE